MELEEMSREQLIEFASAKAGEESPVPSVRKVEVDGMEVTVYTERINTWKAFRLMRRIGTTFDVDSAFAMFEFLEYVTDATEDAIVAHLGGDEKSTIVEVATFASKILAECAPKNS